MGVIFFLVCVTKHESNLLTNIRTTGGKKTQGYVDKCYLLSEIPLLPYFMTACCFSFIITNINVCVFLPMVFINFFITTVCFYDFYKTVLVKKYTPCQDMI